MRKMLSIVSVVLLLLSLLPAFQTPVLANNEDPDPQGKIMGPWNITVLKSYKDRTIEVCGNITIKAGGTLRLDHVTLIMNSTPSAEHFITVETGGSLQLLNGTLVTNNATFDKPYFLTASYGSTLQIQGSQLRRLGNSTATMSVQALGKTGLVVHTNTASIMDSTISDSFMGTVCTNLLPIKPTIINVTYLNDSVGLGISLGCTPTMHDNTYKQDQAGIGLFLKGITVTDISNDKFYNNLVAIASSASSVTVKDSVIQNSTEAGIVALAGSKVDVTKVSFSGNKNSTYLDNSSMTIMDSSITASAVWDFFVDNVSKAVVRNTTIDDRTGMKVNDTSSELDLVWYVDVRAQNMSGASVVGALINITDSKGARVFSTATDATGWTGNILVTELVDKGNGAVRLTPHNITAEKGAYWNRSAVTVEGSQTVVLNVWERDLVLPQISIAFPTDGAHVNTTVLNMSGTASDDKGLALVEISNETGLWVKATGNSTWAGDIDLNGDGLHQVCARATDTSGNAATGCLNVTLDTVPPSLTVKEPIDGQYFNHSQLFVKGSTDADIMKVNGDPVTVFNGNFSYALTLTKEGANEIAVVASDLAGNAVSEKLTVFRDLAAPSILILSPLPGAIVQASAFAVAGNVTDAQGIVGLWASSDNKTWKAADVNYSGAQGTNGAFTASFMLPEGNHTIYLKATDRANNLGTASVNIEIRLPDVVLPTVAIASPTDGQRIIGLVFQVNGTAKDDRSVDRVELSLEGSFWTIASTKDGWAHWHLNLTFKEGSNTIYARALDPSGNKGVTLITITAVKPFVDTEKPVVTVTSVKDGATVKKQKVALRGMASDNVKVKSVLVSTTGATNPTWIAATLDPGSHSWSLNVTLAKGWNNIAVRAIDDAGNSNTTTVSLKYVKPTESSNLTLWVMGILVLVILILAVVFVLTLPGRQKAKKAKDEPLPSEDEEE